MNTSLRNLQEALRIALRNSEVSAGAINEVIRSTVQMEAEVASDIALKSATALDLLSNKDVPAFLSNPPSRGKSVTGASFYPSKNDDVDLDLS